VILTTNGTLLPKMESVLIDSELHKINISLHAFEANDLSMPFDQYLDGCLDFGVHMKGKAIVCYRLWNQGGKDQLNQEILSKLHSKFPGEWIKEPRGTRIADRTYLEYGNKFNWPDLSACDGGDQVFCYGLNDQLGILCDGTVVPCCLDHEGDIALGNLFEQELCEILESQKTKAIIDGFRSGHASEELCRRCGYARRFRK
jgi:radical SAM protein with 4Fe4S-binding SPASM domain